MAKQLTPAQIAAYMQSLGLTAAPPTEAVGAKGSKPFVGDKKSTTSRQKSTEAYKSALKKRVPVQNMNDLSSPAWWAKNIAAGGKSGVVDPVVKASKMDWLNPKSGLNPLERLNTLLGDALTVGSMVTPVKGAATALTDRAIANAWAKSVPNMTKPAGPTAADWFYGQYGVHGTKTPNITQLETRLGSKAFPDEKVTYAFGLGDNSINYDMRQALAQPGHNALTYAPDYGSVYVAKYPRGAAMNTDYPFLVSREPGKVVGEIQLGELGGRAGNVYEDSVTDMSNKLLQMLLKDLKQPSLRKKFIDSFGQAERNRIAEQAANAARMEASNSSYGVLGTRGGSVG